MIASRIARADTRFGPTRFGGSSSAMIGPTIAHSSSGTRQIGGSGSRSCFFLAMLHLPLSRRCSPHASLEIVTNKVWHHYRFVMRQATTVAVVYLFGREVFFTERKDKNAWNLQGDWYTGKVFERM